VNPVRDPAMLVALHEYHPDWSIRTFRCSQNACVRVCFRPDVGLTRIWSLVGDRNTTSGAGSASATQLSITSEVSLATRLGVMKTIRGAWQINSASSRKLTSPAIIYTRQLSYRKEDRAMRPIYGCTEKF